MNQSEIQVCTDFSRFSSSLGSLYSCRVMMVERLCRCLGIIKNRATFLLKVFFFSGIPFHFYCFSPTFLHVNLVVGQQWSSFFPLKSLLAYFTGSHCAFSLFFAIYCIKKKSQFLLLFSLAVVVEVLLSLLPFCCLV